MKNTKGTYVSSSFIQSKHLTSFFVRAGSGDSDVRLQSVMEAGAHCYIPSLSLFTFCLKESMMQKLFYHCSAAYLVFETISPCKRSSMTSSLL